VLGMTNIEALACGTPVITYNSGGSPECVSSQTGFIIGKGEWKKVPEILEKIKSIKHETMQHEALAFDKNKNYMEYIDLYKKLLNV